MKKSKNRSEVSLATVKSETHTQKEEIYIPPLDQFKVKIHDIRIPDEESRLYTVKVTFFDQLLCSSAVTTTGGRETEDCRKRVIARGFMNYDPSDYEKMCLFADTPLIIKIYPFKEAESKLSRVFTSSSTAQSHSSKSTSTMSSEKLETYECTIDILPIFIDTNKIFFQKRLEQIIVPSVLFVKSWDNLPLITLTIKAKRNIENLKHHKILKKANFMKLTLVGSYNMIIPYDSEFTYTAASKLPLENETGDSLVTFNQGYEVPKRFNSLSFYPKWESLRAGEDTFCKGDEKFHISIEELQNVENIDLEYYEKETLKPFNTIWASFHRYLFFKKNELSLSEHLRTYNWPLEVHVYGENCGYSFIAYLDLFKLLYPGETKALLLVPLRWIDTETMAIKCGCEPLISPKEKAPSVLATVQKSSKATTDSALASTNTEISLFSRSTGSDGNSAFVIVEVVLARAFKNPVIPPIIPETEIAEMLVDLEIEPTKRSCTGRGQQERSWSNIIRLASSGLSHVPYFGMSDICTINRQLSETRTRVEIVTSLWQEAAIFVNNNFVVHDFLNSDETFQEMVMIAHACLMRITNDALIDSDKKPPPYSVQKAARHARQLHDLSHAMDLYLQLIVQAPREADSWRELATCLRDIDKDWANVCIDKSIILNPRHPLSLLSKSCMIFEEDPNAAEPFFLALLAFYPFWTAIWAAASAYFLHKEMFHMSDQIMEQMRKTQAEGLAKEPRFPRTWEQELGEWWEETPLLPGTSVYYDAADLLLRLRGIDMVKRLSIQLAEICIAKALLENGDSAVYYHMVALCCRLKGNYADALCHLQEGIDKYGEISYLRSLQGECYHRTKEYNLSLASFEKSGSCKSAYTTLLSLPRRDGGRTRSILTDLVRRHPSAYAWMAFADEWMTRSAVGEGGDANVTEEQRSALANAESCAFTALEYDRRAARAWALLATCLTPSTRRNYCREMAILCGFTKNLDDRPKTYSRESRESLCFRIGRPLRECRCKMCEHIAL
nr:uncharacterized protein LOC116768310 isoform X1 [Danaus plexippus plexippus]